MLQRAADVAPHGRLLDRPDMRAGLAARHPQRIGECFVGLRRLVVELARKADRDRSVDRSRVLLQRARSDFAKIGRTITLDRV